MEKTVAGRLAHANEAISNALSDAELAALLGPAGYTPERLNEGRALYEAAAQAQEDAFTERGEQEGARADVRETWPEVQAGYRRHRALAKPALRDKAGLAKELRLDEREARRQADWLGQARQFYARGLANAEAAALLADVGLTADVLTAGRDAVAAFETDLHDRSKESGESEDATDTRDDVMVPLDRWMRRFRDVARPTLADRPQLLEKLGFHEPS